MAVKRRVATYARVSTELEAQTNAFENQLLWYEDLVGKHPEWQLVQSYSDKGISGTSVIKRPGFMSMMEDASLHKFDLLITREMSRFARNTVDALACTHELKKMGVEVYFVNDNIWSFDPDGDFRMTIMAAMAQEESRKISERTKSGQAMSRKKGIYFGTGNIMGYKRVEIKEANKPKEVRYIIDQEQARTVRKIFDMYLEGSGLGVIQFELERLGYLTATGNTKWSKPSLSGILQNAFYTGQIVYRKQWTPDFLDHKTIKNIDDMPLEYAQGAHEPIVTKQEFDRVQQRLASARTINNGIDNSSGRRQKYFGKKPPKDVWSELLICECGHKFNRKKWHQYKDTGEVQYSYQCYSIVRTGTAKTRESRGLSTDDICRVPMVPQWKLQMMADRIFYDYFHDSNKMKYLINNVKERAKQEQLEKKSTKNNTNEVSSINSQIEKLEKKLRGFQEMRADGDISKEDFKRWKDEIEIQIQSLLKQKQEIEPAESPKNDIELARKRSQFIIDKALDSSNIDESGLIKLSEDAIREFFSKIVVHENSFDWYVRYDQNESPIKCTVEGSKRGSNKPSFGYCNAHNTDLRKEIKFVFLTSFKLTENDAKKYRYEDSCKKRVRRWDDITVNIFI